ncbi:MAG: hypothetical protein ACYTFA_18645 [Planctomycetota bacterium]
MRIAFIVGGFPSLSVTFIINQITSLIDRGHNFDIYADRPEEENKIHSAVGAYRILDRTTYFAVPPKSHPTRITAAMKALFAFWYGAPAGDLRAFACCKGAELALVPLLAEGPSTQIVPCCRPSNGVTTKFTL